MHRQRHDCDGDNIHDGYRHQRQQDIAEVTGGHRSSLVTAKPIVKPIATYTRNTSRREDPLAIDDPRGRDRRPRWLVQHETPELVDFVRREPRGR